MQTISFIFIDLWSVKELQTRMFQTVCGGEILYFHDICMIMRVAASNEALTEGFFSAMDGALRLSQAFGDMPCTHNAGLKP